VVDLASSDLDLILNESGQSSGPAYVVGLRFQAVSIPRAATIHRAYVQFESSERDTGPAVLRIDAEASDDALPFTQVAGDLSSRPRTTAWAGWSPPDWNSIHETGAGQRTADLAAPIQEVVDRAGWTSGSALALLMRGMDLASDRTAESHDGAAARAAELYVEYTPAAPSVLITAPADGASVGQGGLVSFAGSATDPVDGDVSAGLLWDSDLDGAIGSGAGVALSTLSPGVHTITASVTNSLGIPGSAQISLTVNANAPPVVTILEPNNQSASLVDDPLSFAGSALDAEDGDLSAGLVWTSDLDGPIGTGAGFTTSVLTQGTHEITATAIDGYGLAGETSIVTLRLPEPGSEALLAGLVALFALAVRRRGRSGHHPPPRVGSGTPIC
jgi:hypothetical protein